MDATSGCYQILYLLKLYLLLISAKTVSREFYLEKRVYIGRTSYG